MWPTISTTLTFDVTVNYLQLVVEELHSFEELRGIVVDILGADGTVLEDVALHAHCCK